MNIKEAIKNRKSIRQFEDVDVKKEDIKEMLELARRAPSRVNAQHTSIVYTTDKEKIAKLAELTGGQKQVAIAKAFFVVFTDFTRISEYFKEENVELSDDLETLKINGAFDAGVMTALLEMAAMEYGYAGTIIGGVQLNPDKIKELFNLPKESTFINVGFTLGVPTKAAKEAILKPKLSSEALFSEEKYNLEVQKDEVKRYEKILDDWFKSINVPQPLFGEVLRKYFKK